MFYLWCNIITGIIMVAIFLSISFFDKANTKVQIRDVKSIVLAALLIALAVFLNTTLKIFMKVITPSSIFEAKIGNFALVLIGFFCGGILGFLSGIAYDFLGLIISSSGTPILFFTLMSVFWCILPYYLVRLFNKVFKSNLSIYFYLLLSYVLTLLLITSITPIILKYMWNMKDGWWFFYFPRIIKFPFDVAFNGTLLILVFRVFSKSSRLAPAIDSYQNFNYKKSTSEFLLNQW